MQIESSAVTTQYSDGTVKTRNSGKSTITSKKDFRPIGRKHINPKPGVELRDYTSSQFQEFCEYHNHKLSPECIKIADQLFVLHKDPKQEISKLVVLLYGYDCMAQGLDDHDFHFSSPCSVQEVLSTLQDTYTGCQKLLRKFDNGEPQD